jgi:sorbitol-specific phosphotransferase system component IIC
MIRNTGEKCSKLILPVYLIFAIIGTFIISAGEASIFEHSNKDIIDSGRYFSSISCAVDWLAEDTPTIGKAFRFSNSSLRNGLLRVFMFAGTIAIALHFAGMNLKIIKNDNISLVKNHILLKLRI